LGSATSFAARTGRGIREDPEINTHLNVGVDAYDLPMCRQATHGDLDG
jgi:hypothetical protein